MQFGLCTNNAANHLKTVSDAKEIMQFLLLIFFSVLFLAAQQFTERKKPMFAVESLCGTVAEEGFQCLMLITVFCTMRIKIV